MHLAKRRGLTGLAFADHMDISAIPEGIQLAGPCGLQFFTGVEISVTSHAQEYHLLFYGFDPDHAFLGDFLAEHCAALWDKAFSVLDSFSGMGFAIEKDDVDGWGRSIPTGVTFLNALKKKNSRDARLHDYISGSKAASPYLNFYQDFAHTDIGDLLRSTLPDLHETISLFKGSGLLVLAHPGNLGRDFLADLKRRGVEGIEAYSSHHTRDTTRYLVDAAHSLGLLISAGSDFHGEFIKPGIALGEVTGLNDDALIRELKDRSARS